MFNANQLRYKCLLWEQDVVSSNLAAPTTSLLMRCDLFGGCSLLRVAVPLIVGRKRRAERLDSGSARLRGDQLPNTPRSPWSPRYFIAAAVRLRTPSFPKTLFRCMRTVSGEMSRRSAISLFARPSQTKSRTSFSRLLKALRAARRPTDRCNTSNKWRAIPALKGAPPWRTRWIARPTSPGGADRRRCPDAPASRAGTMAFA